MASNDEEGFDLIQPSLIQQLRKILDEYPDDGQILKELIQNAEDAGATHVKFLHDKNSYGKALLYDKKLEKFQGPALYSYNNALFTEEDWKGIRLVCDSIKVEDPMKVGRFGLGFKSVFHMTDLPSLLSKYQIGFIDPHGVHFSDEDCKRTGKRWRLREDCADIERFSDQFNPYKGVFDCTDEVFTQGFYNGTLFRFPLRSSPSKLSETLYTAEKVDTLFESFKADAQLMLVFLQHLDSIELYVREENEFNPRRVFQVKIADESLQTVREKREEFRWKIAPGKVMPDSVTVTYPVTIETVDFDLQSTNSTKKHSFLVTNYFCGGQVSSTFKKLMTDKVLGYLPMVGVAMALPTGPRLKTPDIKGHVFCFLPLPVQQTSLTGLPVHVNGFFALNQNRRYIKFPNADQEDLEKGGRHLTDRSLLWNKCLLEEAIPRAYATMISEAIKEKTVFVPKAAIYKAWPDIHSINHTWRGLEKTFFQLLLDKNVVHTHVNGGSWVKVQEAIFQQMSEERWNDLLLRVLLSVGLPAVAVPRHVHSALEKYSSDQTEMEPPLIRHVLRQVPSCYVNLERQEKLLLLQFSLIDCHFSDLDGLQLLPLSNGQFAKFETLAKTVYIASSEHPQALFPGLADRFLDTSIHKDVLLNLKEAVSQGSTQLRLLGTDDVPSLLWQSLPCGWNIGHSVSWFPEDTNQNHPPRDWIQLVWRYLEEHFTTAKDLQSLTGLPLIPVSMSQTPVTLTQLCPPSKVVVKRLNWDSINDALAGVLEKIGILVMRDFPVFISHHPAVLGTYINPPSVKGVIKAMAVCFSSMVAGTFLENIRGMSIHEKQILRAFLANARPEHVGSEEYNLLCSLPLFQTHSMMFVSKKEGLCAASPECLPIQPLQDLIDISEDASKALAHLLEVRILKPTELLCEVIFPDIQQGKYTEAQVDRLMSHVFRNLAHAINRDDNFRRHLQVMPFVPKQTTRVRASEVFDPRCEKLQTLFSHEDVFPVGELYMDPAVLIILEALGMKKEKAVTAKDLFQSAKRVSVLPPLLSVRQKSMAILQYLSIHPHKLHESLNGLKLGTLLTNIGWVCRLQQRPWNFPSTLPWCETGEEEIHFFKPTEIKSQLLTNLIGTVKPVVIVEPSNEICKYFGWKNKPDVIDVVQHLQNVVACYTKKEKPYYMVVVDEIYFFLSGVNQKALHMAFNFAKISEWVWNGDGFSSPYKVLPSETKVDLAPYILPLPSEMKKFIALFQCFGMKVQSDPALLLEVLNMIKRKYDDRNFQYESTEVKRDLKLSVEILNELATEELCAEMESKIVFPIHVEGNTVQLEPATRCMYCEHDEWLTRDGDDEDMEYFYLHPNIPSSTAERLGVPSLTNRMLDPEELFIGEEFGQEEKLTTRLNRLLEDYTDGFAVPKELIQNADDAGATEVRFLYDERTNENAMTCLIDEGMKGCQGPAFWVYNDATFKDEDFVNITKLNEATKAEDTEKIGRFGLGFNAVYNLTDVPMFVSRQYFAMFDPHTSHLGKAIKNKRRPGIKINLNKDISKLRKFKNQFQPFNGIFGCDLHLDKEDNSFDGTLFRFPLRTKEQAITSEIKQLCYDEQQMRELLQMFIHGANNLLLFTQNVLRVGIYHVPSHDSQPTLMFEVRKSTPPAGILRELSFSFTLPPTALKFSPQELTFLKQCNFLQAASKLKKSSRDRTIDPTKFPASSMIIDINCSLAKYGRDFFSISLPKETATWLVVSSMGTGKAMKAAKHDPALLPSAGVAVQLEPRESNTFFPLPVIKRVAERNLNGTIFCYLPLPIHSGLFVHINGAFAVASSRRNLQQRVEDDKMWFGVDWNNVLMQDSVASAFLDLLGDLRSKVPNDGSYVFHSLWPRASEVQHSCWPLLTSFYAKLAGNDYPLFSNGKEWVGLKQIAFLDPHLRNDPRIGVAASRVLQMCRGSPEVVVDLPFDVLHSFEVCGHKKEINAYSYDKSRFFNEIFFPNIVALPSNLRDVLTLYALDDNNGDLYTLVTQSACIPASPSGNTLRAPRYLVHPGGEVASLFSPEEGRFPFGTNKSYLSPHRLATLELLGMTSNGLPWSEVAERAESIHNLNRVDSKAALKRLDVFIHFLEKKIKLKEPIPSSVHDRLLNTRFLPVLKKPCQFPLPWKGDEVQKSSDQVLLAPKETFMDCEKYLVCCTEPLVGIYVPRNVRALLNLENKRASWSHVMEQLHTAMLANVTSLNIEQMKDLENVCKSVYAYLDRAYRAYGDRITEPLLGMNFILVERRFLSARKLAFNLALDCAPYLFRLPQQLAESFAPLLKGAGVKTAFDEQDYISRLHDVKKQFGEVALDEKTLQVATRLALLLGESVRDLKYKSSPSNVHEKPETVYLPDSKGVMRPVPDLCIRDCPWMPDEEGVRFVNDGIPWPTCFQLNIKTRRAEALRPHIFGIPFGQREKLTNRLKRILTGYPCEKEILKELLQNADDAQATEICFIKDPRHHLDKRVFEDSWKQLQGPALCVYNNKPFTDADINGIRNLGEGSKGEDPNKTGQYGVGFNAVYHLTDVPSFMSKGEDIGDVLCVFDPHCRYVPRATVSEPGIMLRDIPALRKKFPDVFSCYLEEHFPIDNGTMFRFPLRTQEMSRVSKISPNPVTIAVLNTMMEELKKELFEVLLFVNSVKKITLCDVSEESGGLVNAYSVEATMSKEDDAKRQVFANYIKKIGEKMKDGKVLLPSDIQAAKVSFVLNIEDNLGRKETWLIVQQIGFEKNLNNSIIKAFKKRDIGMLPRGGVACLLDRTPCREEEKRKKAFCFLPLPLETNLPVHINGHFALDHEARRSLWREEAGGYRSDWNNALLADVVASCYFTLLSKVRTVLQLPIARKATSCTVACSPKEVLERISAYENLFPLHAPVDPYWRTLVDSLYQELNLRELNVLPVVRSKPLDMEQEVLANTSVVEITWLPPTGRGRNQAFFNNLSETKPFAQKEKDENQIKSRKRFKEILIESGFNLVAFSSALHDAFQRANVPTCIVSPSSVTDFYKSTSSQEPLCKIGNIPCRVEETPFKDAHGVILVLQYCKGAKSFCDRLPGLPLLLTQDNCLQLFSSKEPKFLSRYQDILPGSPHIFLHQEVYWKFFHDALVGPSSVLKPLDAQGFVDNLPLTLPQERYRKAAFVEWFPYEKGTPDQRWISRVWAFLGELTRDILDDPSMDEESKVSKIKAALESLANWSILPATESKPLQNEKLLLSFSSSMMPLPPPAEQILVPLGKATSVLDFSRTDSTNLKLMEVLRNLGVPELNDAALSNVSLEAYLHSLSNAVALARLMVSSLKFPSSLLACLDQRIKENPLAPARLLPAECRVILEYFSRSVSCLQDVDRHKLKKLPFYQATHGGFIRLDQHRSVCVLPTGIPKRELDLLEEELSVRFLESCSSLSDLYQFLGLGSLSVVDVSCKCILPNLSVFSNDARQSHLDFIRKRILSNILASDGDKTRLLNCLQNVPFISSEDGSLRTACSFFDPFVDVFNIMLSSSSFPPKPYDSVEWLTVFRKIGLVHVVSQDHFKRFAREIAHEAAAELTKETYQKSQVLIKHLMKRPNVVAEGLLPDVCDINFVATKPVRKELRDLCEPFRVMADGNNSFGAFKEAMSSDYEDIVWTKACLLPRWADPTHHKSELGCPKECKIERYCNDFMTQLQIAKKPSVDLVVKHCQTICFLPENKRERATKKVVMERIYDFLQAHLISNSEEKEQLTNTPCVLVEEGKKFVLPSQTVLELHEELEIRPYLYRVPREFGKFHPLFEVLGCSKYVMVGHYAMVLEKLHESSKNAKLHPNEVIICVKAGKGFFEQLEKNGIDVNALPRLYLPGVSQESDLDDSLNLMPVTLHKSKDLIFNDKPPALLNRLRKFKHHFLLDLEIMNVVCSSAMTNHKELLMKLPPAVRPRMLSSVVNENFSNAQNNVIVPAEAVDLLKQQLSSPEFCSGVIRLIRDVNFQNKAFDEVVIESIKRGLRAIDICAVTNLKTTLFCDGVPIPESEANVSHFLEKKSIPGGEGWTVYVDAVVAMAESTLLTSLVSHVIAELYGGLLGRRAELIFQMLKCPMSEIWAFLDSLDVRADDSFRSKRVKIFPPLGTFVPIEDHHLLNDAFEEFEPDEYVGYELGDPTLHHENGVATYIYGRIVKEVTDESSSLLTKRYKISIGGNQEIEVDATDLYKFHRLDTPTSLEIVLSEHQQQSSAKHPVGRPRSRNKQAVFDEVSDLLEEAWKLPEEKRKKVIKRFYLRWHPDKNVGDEEFCNEVFKHVQNEVSRLERGDPRGTQQPTNVPGTTGSHRGSYDHFFTTWGIRANQHHSQREGYRRRQQFHGSCPRRPNPQPGEARRWFRQAEADVAAAENDIIYSKPSYEWACFKCHQAAEKALKAAKYTTDVDKSNTHNLNVICCGLDDPELLQLASELEGLVVSSTRMRYPDNLCFPRIPNEVYNAQMSESALRLAKGIVERVKSRIP